MVVVVLIEQVMEMVVLLKCLQHYSIFGGADVVALVMMM